MAKWRIERLSSAKMLVCQKTLPGSKGLLGSWQGGKADQLCGNNKHYLGIFVDAFTKERHSTFANSPILEAMPHVLDLCEESLHTEMICHMHEGIQSTPFNN